MCPNDKALHVSGNRRPGTGSHPVICLHSVRGAIRDRVRSPYGTSWAGKFSGRCNAVGMRRQAAILSYRTPDQDLGSSQHTRVTSVRHTHVYARSHTGT